MSIIPYGALRGPLKEWTVTLQLDGQLVDLAGALPRRSLGFGQARGTCTLETRAFPDAPAGCPAKVLVTLNHSYTVTFFSGRLDARPIADLPLRFEIGLVDSLARLDVPLDEDLVWRGRSFTGAVRDLLHAAGFADAEIGAIHDPGSDFKLGPIDAIQVPAGTVVNDALSKLLTFGGCGLFVLPEGQLAVVDAPGWPADTDDATPVYAFGASLAEMGFFNARRTVVGAESVVARFTARGPRLSTRKIADATFALSGVSGKAVTETYDLLQTDACARKIAEREIVRRNRSATEVDVSCPLNPNLRPGDTVRFRHPELGFPANTPAIVIGCSSNGDEMTLNLSVGARHPAGDISTIPPPSPTFTLSFEVQPVKLAGVMAVNTVVECKDTSTDPSGFGITGRSWVAACAGDVKPEPETVEWSYDEAKTARENPVPNPIVVFPTLEGATVTLTVESKSGEGATLTRPVVPPAGAVFTRTISVASGAAGWRVLAGASGWRDFMPEGSCTAVPTINDSGPLLAGFSNGAIYKSDDYLATEPVLLSTLPASVTCMWVNEGNPLEVLAGAGDTLYRSSSGGLAWTAAATFPEVVEYCESSPANAGEVRVCAGNKLYLALDGASFAELLSGPEGTLCRKVGSAPWGHLAVFSGTASIADAWKFEEGYSIDWSQVAPEHLPTELAAVTPLQYEEGYLVADGGASDLIRDGLFGQLGYLANLGVTRLYKLMPAGAGFVATYCAETTDGGPHKVVMAGGKAFAIDVGDALRIGYGQATDPARPPQLLVAPKAVGGALDRLWHYLPDLGQWTSHELPIAGQTWSGLAVCPSQPSAWLIWTPERIYFTGDAGTSWIQAYLPPWGQLEHGVQDVCFTGVGRQWVASVLYTGAWGTSRWAQAYYALGDGPDVIQAASNGAQVVSPAPVGPFTLLTNLSAGVNGEVFGHASVAVQEFPSFGIAPASQIAWMSAASLSLALGPETPYRPASTAAADTRKVYAVWERNIGLSGDYRSAAPLGLLAAGTSVVATAAGTFVGGRDGLVELREPTPGQLTATTVIASGLAVGRVSAGSRRRGTGALATPPEPAAPMVLAHNGIQWTTTALPDGLTTVCERIGVIEL